MAGAITDAADRVCKLLRKNAADVLLAKKAGKPEGEIRTLVTQGSLLMQELRGANRDLYESVEGVKEETEESKKQVEDRYSVLQNLLYEKNHYDKEIRGCKDFTSAYAEGDIELMPEAEFAQAAPEEATKGEGDEHRMMLGRLAHELAERKALVAQRESLRGKGKKLQEGVKTKRKFLDSLQMQVKDVKKATLPLQQHLAIEHTKETKEIWAGRLLPAPLYVVFTQLQGYKDAFAEPIAVSIHGSATEAEALARQEAAESLVARGGGEEGEAAGAGAGAEEDDDEDNEGGKGHRKKRQKVEDDTYAVHPLSVTLVLLKEGSSADKLMSMRFEYLRKLHLVCVSCEDTADNALLVNFFPGDTGEDTPNVANKQLGTGLGARGFDKGRPARPFLWAQHLAGLDFLPEVPPKLAADAGAGAGAGTGAGAGGEGDGLAAEVAGRLQKYRGQGRVKTLLERLRARKQAATSLKAQLAALQNLKIPIQVPSSAVPFLPKSTLRNWVDQDALRARREAEAKAREELEAKEREAREAREREAQEARREREAAAAPSTGSAPAAAPAAQEEGELGELPSASAPAAEGAPPAAPPEAAPAPASKELGEAPSAAGGAGKDGEAEEGEAEEGEEGEAEAEAVAPWHEWGARRFRAAVRHAERRVEIEALFTVYAEYPVRPPRVQLRLRKTVAKPLVPPPAPAGAAPAPARTFEINESSAVQAEAAADLRTIEAEVNIHCRGLVPAGQSDLLLSYQVMRLLQCLDVHVANERWAGAPPGGSADAVGRAVRGRERRKALVPDPATRTYDHR